MAEFVLVINCGSSSLKFALIDPESGDAPISGNAEHLGSAAATITHKYQGDKKVSEIPNANHEDALNALVKILRETGLDKSVQAIGHRIVHGGESLTESVLVDDSVRNKIYDIAKLSPVHNYAHVQGIDAARRAFPDLKNVVVIDTAFHKQIPERAYLYALPYKYYTDYHIRKYGFHGTSYRYISSVLNEVIGADKDKKLKSIVCHLGNGGSVGAVDYDHTVDTTMGLTPLEGIVHGTRTGDLDPAAHYILQEEFKISLEELNEVIWKKSGLLGLSGITNNCKELEDLAKEGNQDALRALEVYCYRLAKHIAGQFIALGGCDVLVFTGGIGENSVYVRRRTTELLNCLGFFLDENRNVDRSLGSPRSIHSTESKYPIWIIPTNEELMIARDTIRLVK